MAQGLYAGSKGARTAGRGGAVGAKADDLSAMEYNPAGLARLGTTTIQLSNRFSYNQTKYTRQPTIDGAGGTEIVYFDEVKNEKPWQLLEPLLAVGTNFGLKNFGFALGAYAPSGIAQESFPLGAQSAEEGGPNYRSEGGQRYMMKSRESQILIYALSGAYKFKDLFGIGATLQWISVPKLKYSLAVAPVPFGVGGENVRSSFDMVSEIEGHDYFTFNTVLGAWVRPLPFLELALSGQIIPADIKAKSKLKVTQISTGDELLLQRAATGECDPATRPEGCVDDVELTIPLPLWVRAAARFFKENEEKQLLWDLELDFVYQTWSRVKSFELTSDNLVGVLSTSAGARYELPVGDITVAKEWRNVWQLQVGSDVAIVPGRFVVRAGAGYESPAAWKKLYTAIDFPTGDHISGALGASAYFGGFELALAYAYRRQVHVTVDEGEGRIYQQAPGAPCQPPYTDPSTCPYLGKPTATVNGGIYKSFSHFITVDGIYRF